MNDPARFGPLLDQDGVAFRLWAPAARRVELMLDGAHAMPAAEPGWYALHIPGARAGARYKFRIDGELEVPDPASMFQPEDVAGPSEVVDHAYAWTATDWRGRPWHKAVFVELHVATFTPEGTFRAAIGKLDHLVDTGVTAIEIMPVADFAGRRNWGYDGVLWFAPDSAYGRPDDLKALIDAAHARGLMVFLDVVYNHFGPEGNYLGRYAPSFFTQAHTPWGSAIDYRVPEVRAFVIANALHWLRDFRFDGLRLDAVHAIVEPGEPPILHDLSRAVGALATATGRHIHLVLENDDNHASLLDPAADPPRGKYRAQWNDDYHHCWHVLLTGETHGYYRDYTENTRRRLVRILESGFTYQGESSPHRDGRARGEPSGHLPPTAFVDFLQNHDQIGNRAFGERLTVLTAPAPLEAALAVTLLAPMPPLLFMGEEWGAREPFPFFCDFSGELAEAVRRGRHAEFKEHYMQARSDWPDPLSEETFAAAVLDWSARETEAGRRRLALVRSLLDLRRREIVPRLAGLQTSEKQASLDGTVVRAEWTLNDGAVLGLVANLSDEPADRPYGPPPRRMLWSEAPGDRLAPWAVHWSIR
jgi:malto-oligosyltrehalose trehalohydrolase